MKISLAFAGAVLLVGTLAGCGGSDSGSDASDGASAGSDSSPSSSDGDSGSGGGDYCDAIKTAASKFQALSSGDVDGLDEAFTTFHELAGEAPSEVKDDWELLDGVITKVEKAFADAGIEVSDLSEIAAGKTPEGVDVTKLQGLATEFQSLSTAEFEKAADDIDAHAKSECGVSLSGE